ncbi:hypothetical protein [Halorussus salinisoli]|uniref:hypothetical protein n=1 Tax=Halorussus salinisoli TaxID=2558242 RepID=UPI0010C20A31|nr:hypothetical protein [Halorussus salinisoli]
MTRTCTTRNNAFAGYDIPSGTDLVHKTWYLLIDRGYDTFEPTEVFANQLGEAFRTAFVRTAPVPIVPEPVDEAIIDAASITVYEHGDQPDADLRTVVLPSFYRAVADLYCDYRIGYPDGGVGVWFEASDDSHVNG